MDFCESFSVCSVPSRSPFVPFRRPEHFCARSLSPTRTTLKRYRSHPSRVMLLSRSNFDQLGQKKRSLPKKGWGSVLSDPGGTVDFETTSLKGKLKQISKKFLIVSDKSAFFWRLSNDLSVFRVIPLLCLWLTASFNCNMSNIRLGPHQL